MTNTRFSTAIHLLTELAFRPGELLNSATLAEKIKCHPVVIRRLVGALKKASVVTSTRGAGGGVELAMQPEDISLSMIAELFDEHLAFETHSLPVSALETDHFSDAVLSTLENERRKVHLAGMSHLDGVALSDVLTASILRSELTALVASGLTDEEIRTSYRIENGHLVRS